MPINSFENYPMNWKPKRPSKGQILYKALAEQLEQDINNGFLLSGIGRASQETGISKQP